MPLCRPQNGSYKVSALTEHSPCPTTKGAGTTAMLGHKTARNY